MTDGPNEHNDIQFPILRGESVGESGEFSGVAVIVTTPDELNREWASNEIAVLKQDLELHFVSNPGDLDVLFTNVAAVLAEFGEPIGEFAAVAYSREAIGVVKVDDATNVLEADMHIRVVAMENLGEVFFID